MTMSIAEKRRTFRQLHESGCFVIPNPWDVGSARYLQHLGFKALATTSSGYAISQGLPDGEVTRDRMLAHIAELVAATDVPVNADFENGHAHEPSAVAENVRLCVETGVAGLSIEDATGDAAKPLYDLDAAVARIRSARAAIDKADGSVVFTARAECFLVGRPDLDETIQRLRAYANAGADCLYAPGIKTREQIAVLIKAAAPKPVNILMSAPLGFSVDDLAGLGARRISAGGGLARAAWTGFMRAAQGLAEKGSFDGFADLVPGSKLNALFAEDVARRRAP
jgi:2-methylisocitrate lyase-like PEP mutase family enzyme